MALHVNLKWLKDKASNKFYPIITRDCLIGGIGRGSKREVLDFSSYINTDYTGEFTLKIMAGHVKYYSIDISKIEGVFSPGDNILTGPIPVSYYPTIDLVFTSSINPDTTSKISVYLSSSDGRLHLYINNRYTITNNPLTITPLITANNVTGVAPIIE